MDGSQSESAYLPQNIAISERSRKFYETYKWDSEGFTDEKGVYRKFDCYDPEAYAPTPLPPMAMDDLYPVRMGEETTRDYRQSNTKQTSKLDDQKYVHIRSSAISATGIDGCQGSDQTSEPLIFPFQSMGEDGAKTIYLDEEIGPLESMEKRVGIASSSCEQKANGSSNNNENAMSRVEGSDQTMEHQAKVKQTDVATVPPEPVKQEKSNNEQPKRKSSTRGVAQRATKKARKSDAAECGPWVGAASSLQVCRFERQSPESEDMGLRRRSARLAQARTGG